MLKLRFSATSPYVRKVMVLAHERGLVERIEKIPTTVLPTTPNEEMQRDVPLLKVPALTTDEGDTLFDSRVICEYLDGLHGGEKVLPRSGRARFEALRLQALADGILDAAILTRYETSLRPKALRWSAWIDGQLRKIRGGLTALDQEAGGFGDRLTIGTIAAGCALGYLDFRFAGENWRQTNPALARWYAAFSQRPSMQATVPVG
jgi:glutathione S-transferase